MSADNEAWDDQVVLTALRGAQRVVKVGWLFLPVLESLEKKKKSKAKD